MPWGQQEQVQNPWLDIRSLELPHKWWSWHTVGDMDACLGHLVVVSPLPGREQEDETEANPNALDCAQDEST